MMTVGESGSNLVDANMKINGALQQQEEQQLDLMKVNYGLNNGLPVEAGENKAEHEDLETKIGSTEVKDGEKLTMVRILSVSQNRRALLSAVPTLTLGIMGGAVLPVSWAFSVTGVVCGIVIMVLVAAANAYTSDMLLRQAHHTGTTDYESLALVTGGRWWKLTTEISIVVLLVGTLVGGIAQVGEAAAIGLTSIWPNTPAVFTSGSGRLLMAIATVFIIAPLCLVRRLRQLEYAGMVGTAIVLWLMGAVVIDCSKHNFPALRSHDLATVGFSSIGNVTQAISIFGFAFYIQPIMMPLLLEMPKGKVGVKLISWSTRIVVLVNAFIIYGVVGFFGAAYYGSNTEQNILVNQWLGGGVAQGILNLSMAVYLAIANPTIEFPTRHTIDGWISTSLIKNRLVRHLGETGTILGFSLMVALIWPSSSGNVLVVTGATGVCMVSYVIPVMNHFLLFFSKAKCQKGTANTTSTTEVTLEEGVGSGVLQQQPNVLMSYRNARKPGILWLVLEYLEEICLPLLVLVLGFFCSVAALTTL
ncbi:unnamed protein product [Sphagnum troendelagicum]|uniref:Amino acid transporter transmembrane domain-containing protein n=1 Tax=Sphagnum troendelagicum TaxID=128251 RepID=A0ABP0UCY9_9BRYO